jgi:hypothetical protein
MNQMTLPKIGPPAALHRAASDLPFVTFLDGGRPEVIGL